MAANNNSPVFSNFPPLIICKDFPLNFNHSAVDADGDILVYSFCQALAGGGNITSPPDVSSCIGAVPSPPCPPPFNNVPYAVPAYTPTAPMAGNPVVNISAVSGFITGTPQIIGQFVVAILSVGI